MEESRFPKGEAKRTVLVEAIGRDGSVLLDAIYSTPELNWLGHLESVEILRRVWVQQFEVIEGQLRFRSDDNIPKTAKMICSPYDIDATYGRIVPTWWIGYPRPSHGEL
jgi:hypothetical protein